MTSSPPNWAGANSPITCCTTGRAGIRENFNPRFDAMGWRAGRGGAGGMETRPHRRAAGGCGDAPAVAPGWMHNRVHGGRPWPTRAMGMHRTHGADWFPAYAGRCRPRQQRAGMVMGRGHRRGCGAVFPGVQPGDAVAPVRPGWRLHPALGTGLRALDAKAIHAPWKAAWCRVAIRRARWWIPPRAGRGGVGAAGRHHALSVAAIGDQAVRACPRRRPATARAPLELAATPAREHRRPLLCSSSACSQRREASTPSGRGEFAAAATTASRSRRRVLVAFVVAREGMAASSASGVDNAFQIAVRQAQRRFRSRFEQLFSGGVGGRVARQQHRQFAVEDPVARAVAVARLRLASAAAAAGGAARRHRGTARRVATRWSGILAVGVGGIAWRAQSSRSHSPRSSDASLARRGGRAARTGGARRRRRSRAVAATAAAQPVRNGSRPCRRRRRAELRDQALVAHAGADAAQRRQPGCRTTVSARSHRRAAARPVFAGAVHHLQRRRVAQQRRERRGQYPGTHVREQDVVADGDHRTSASYGQ